MMGSVSESNAKRRRRSRREKIEKVGEIGVGMSEASLRSLTINEKVHSETREVGVLRTLILRSAHSTPTYLLKSNTILYVLKDANVRLSA